ncbi:MAG: creatininase family protein [candidate division Zixibacteria bacterium]|nr:creatininase family protein [candidate division Zixibacteria bacterium]
MLYKLENLNWMEFKELVPKKIETVILPVGTIEAHGVISLGTDVQIPQKIAEMIAEDLKAIIAPPVYYGVTRSLYFYPGSLSVTSQTFENYLCEILDSMAEKGFSRIVVINGHGGHLNELKNAALKVYKTRKAKIAVIHWWLLCDDITKQVYGVTGGHAGVDETAGILAIDKTLVKNERYKKEMAYKYDEAMNVMPTPSSIILYKEKEGYPDFDEKKAKVYLNKVAEKIRKMILEVFKKWDGLRL